MTPKATLHGISRMISSHGYALLYYHDPLSSKRGQKNRKPGSQNWDTTFLFPLLVMVTSSLYGNLFMALSEADSQDFSWAVLKTSPRMMYHQATPSVIWTQTDVSWTNLVLVTTALYAISLQNPCTLDRYQAAVPSQGSSVRLSIHGKTLSSSVLLAILSTHKRIRKVSLAGLGSFYLFTNVLVFAHFLFINAVYTVSVKDALLWVLLFLHIFYMLYGYFWIFTAAILTIQILHIRQQALLKQLNQLNELLLRSCRSKKRKNHVPLSRLWQQFLTANRSVAELAALDTRRWSAFWSPFLTVHFLGFTTFQCYLLYIVTFVPTLSALWRAYFSAALLNWTAIQLYVIGRCSEVVRRNGALERANRRFYLLAFVGAGAQLKTEAKTAAEAEAETETAAERAQKRILARAIILLKAELLQGSHRLQPYCLVLLDNYRITSKTFYLLFSYVAVFFLMIFKQQQQQQ